ncbi:PREDICTED: bromodomain-containing protein 4 isoform X7 [Nicrophorus vespilloides]|uniref:Nuclear protein MDM1 n=1 Tax=Nicrophorus vespilloides TaxID=110193 RepID=A0ABM1N080_NICVS|nr:PREDICTED: bromodomain-containing protein 4 isoform X7 [Nicrophorus vespilloides]
MIGSFWNLCRACPSMPVDKLHSEYRSTYRWHEYTGPRQEVVRRAPQGGHANAVAPSDEKRHDFGNATRIDEESTEMPTLEPALPRRKKHPDLAYRHHEFILSDGNNFADDFEPYVDRARSEERGVSNWRPSRRSKSEGPARSNALTNGERRRDSNPDIPDAEDTHRGWGSKFGPEKATDIYNKQVELWDQVSRRSSLSALSLASTAHRSYTKEEKDQENTKKSSPTKALRNTENSVKIMKDMIRHHLERTTGGSEFDGLILSPTREKLEPTIPKRDDDSRGSQKNSPKKNSPQKSALQKKNSLKAKSALRTARSQSVGPTDMGTEKKSPKRQSRSTAAKAEKKTSAPPVVEKTVPVSKRPRPSSLNTTTASSRSKSSSVPPKHEEDRMHTKSKPNNSTEPNDQKKASTASEVAKVEKVAPEVTEPEPIHLEPVVKSPPEPTRVKSPEQIIMRSPDPVNWTVPLDTGKTFTVTQNVREGDLAARPHSEVKAWTPPDVPLPIAQSAPPQLSEPCKDQARRQQDNNWSNTTANITAYPPTIDPILTVQNMTESSTLQYGTTGLEGCHLLNEVATATSLRQKNEPLETETPVQSLAADVLKKARNRFDSFWRKNSNEEPV